MTHFELMEIIEISQKENFTINPDKSKVEIRNLYFSKTIKVSTDAGVTSDYVYYTRNTEARPNTYICSNYKSMLEAYLDANELDFLPIQDQNLELRFPKWRVHPTGPTYIP